MRQHTVIGERILGAAPALAGAAKLVRCEPRARGRRRATPTASAATRSRWAHASSPSATPTTQCSTKRAYRPTPMSQEGALAELAAARGLSSTRTWWRPSWPRPSDAGAGPRT